MPLYRLNRSVEFPDPNLALPDGLLAVGGDLREERLLNAYAHGIFPWYSDGEPILWWSPDPRMVLLPHELHVSKRFARDVRRTPYRVTLDTAFADVMRVCARVPRRGQNGTWITREMTAAYCGLHGAGYAHSVECWDGETLIGGLYGVSLGRCFFGESMFALEPNASKIALARLVELLISWDFALIDCQVHTDHLERMGARNMPRVEFLRRLKAGLDVPTRVGPWAFPEE